MRKTTPLILLLLLLLAAGALASCTPAGETQDGPQVVVYRAPT